MRAHFSAALVAAAACLIEVATARYECHPELIAGQYPFCVNVPDTVTHEHHDGRFPTVLYLGGSGTFGRPDDIETSVSGYLARSAGVHALRLHLTIADLDVVDFSIRLPGTD